MIRAFLAAFLAALLGLVVSVAPAAAQNCAGSFPNTLTNGTNADAAQVMANFTFLLNCLNNLPAPTPGGGSSTRQTVTAGPVTAAGLPNFLPATTVGLSLTSVNVSSTVPLTVTAANNSDPTSGAQKDLVGIATSNLTWTSLAASTTNYLYVTVATTGTLTTGSTTQAPAYQPGGTPGTAAGQFTFNIGERRGFLGNGTTASQAYIVFVGEAATSGSSVTSTVAYAYNGLYDSGYTQNLPSTPNTATSKNHNIGVIPRFANFLIQCTTPDQGYSVGDELGPPLLYTNDGAINVPFGANVSSLTVSIAVQSVFSLNAKSTGGRVSATGTSWKYRFIASRGW